MKYLVLIFAIIFIVPINKAYATHSASNFSHTISGYEMHVVFETSEPSTSIVNWLEEPDQNNSDDLVCESSNTTVHDCTVTFPNTFERYSYYIFANNGTHTILVFSENGGTCDEFFEGANCGIVFPVSIYTVFDENVGNSLTTTLTEAKDSSFSWLASTGIPVGGAVSVSGLILFYGIKIFRAIAHI